MTPTGSLRCIKLGQAKDFITFIVSILAKNTNTYCCATVLATLTVITNNIPSTKVRNTCQGIHKRKEENGNHV